MRLFRHEKKKENRVSDAKARAWRQQKGAPPPGSYPFFHPAERRSGACLEGRCHLGRKGKRQDPFLRRSHLSAARGGGGDGGGGGGGGEGGGGGGGEPFLRRRRHEGASSSNSLRSDRGLHLVVAFDDVGLWLEDGLRLDFVLGVVGNLAVARRRRRRLEAAVFVACLVKWRQRRALELEKTLVLFVFPKSVGTKKL
jgi:hypothetical protein